MMSARWPSRWPSWYGLSSALMALITSDCINGPNHLALQVESECFGATAIHDLKPGGKVRAPPQHGLSSKKMALITSEYGIMSCLSIKWP